MGSQKWFVDMKAFIWTFSIENLLGFFFFFLLIFFEGD